MYRAQERLDNITRAIEEGINPYRTIYESKALTIDSPTWGRFTTKTYSESYRGPISVSSATLSSEETAFSKTTVPRWRKTSAARRTASADDSAAAACTRFSAPRGASTSPPPRKWTKHGQRAGADPTGRGRACISRRPQS